MLAQRENVYWILLDKVGITPKSLQGFCTMLQREQDVKRTLMRYFIVFGILLIACTNLAYGMDQMCEKRTDNCTTEFSFILGVSNVAGVGVFATHDIPKGTKVFFIPKKKCKIKDIPKQFLMYVVYVNDEECFCPTQFDRIDVLWYINHSYDPNVIESDDIIIAARDIKAGEEILFDYNQLNEPEHLKEPYYLMRFSKNSFKMNEKVEGEGKTLNLE